MEKPNWHEKNLESTLASISTRGRATVGRFTRLADSARFRVPDAPQFRTYPLSDSVNLNCNRSYSAFCSRQTRPLRSRNGGMGDVLPVNIAEQSKWRCGAVSTRPRRNDIAAV